MRAMDGCVGVEECDKSLERVCLGIVIYKGWQGCGRGRGNGRGLVNRKHGRGVSIDRGRHVSPYVGGSGRAWQNW